MRPDFLAIGHVAKDLTPDGHRIGGAVTYGSITAREMGVKTAAVAGVGPGIDMTSVLQGVPVHQVQSRDTTTFINMYHEGRRQQVLKGVGDKISAEDVPEEWRSAPLVLLGPLVPTMSYDFAKAFSSSTVLACIQGWMRQWDDEGRVSPAHWDGGELLPYVDVAILSIDDLSDRSLIDVWKEKVPILIVTRGREGASLHRDGQWHHIRAFPTCEVDPTGAGDVFAAAYLVRFRETSDPLESALFASCVASFSVEAEGADGIPTRAQVEERLRSN